MPKTYRFKLLIPPQANLGTELSDIHCDQKVYDQFLRSVQRLRGRIYLEDGAIQASDMNADGRFAMQGDEQCWHLLLTNDTNETIGCARYLVHPNTVSLHRLNISQSPIARSQRWGDQVRLAVAADLGEAWKHSLSYVEIGGWALCESWRRTGAALEMLTASYALAPLWGGCLASCAATVRHGSAAILRKIGGTSLEARGEQLPPYGDIRYGCFMELLRFDSRSPAQRLIPLIHQLQGKIANAPKIRRGLVGPASTPFNHALTGQTHARPYDLGYRSAGAAN
jgi:hypothetical protein